MAVEAIGGVYRDPWLMAAAIDRPKDDDDDEYLDYRPSSRRPNNADSRLRRRQRMRLFRPDLAVAVAAPFQSAAENRLMGGDDDDDQTMENVV